MNTQPTTVADARPATVALMVLLAAMIAVATPVQSAALLGVGVLGLAVLLRPAVGLAALALALPFGILLLVPGTPADGADMLAVLVVAAWLAGGLAARRVTVAVPRPVWPLLAFIWVGAWSLTQAVSWREGLPEWLKWVEVAALYLVAAQVLHRRTSAWVVGGLLAAGVAQAALGAVQFWRQIGPEAFVLLGRFMRAYGTFGQPNPYAGYLGYLAPVGVSVTLGALGVAWETRRPTALLLALASGAASVAIIAGIGLSWSRGAWIALAAALLVVIGFRNRRAALLTLTVLVFGGLLLLSTGTEWLPGPVSGRVAELGDYFGGFDPARTEITDANFSVLERVAHWRAGLAMFADHPWLGVGIGNYAAAYGDYAPPHWYEPLGHAHNLMIHMLAETGILGALTFGAFWLALALVALGAARSADAWTHMLAIGALGTWIYVSVHGVFDSLFVQHMQLNLALLWGALFAVSRARPLMRANVGAHRD